MVDVRIYLQVGGQKDGNTDQDKYQVSMEYHHHTAPPVSTLEIRHQKIYIQYVTEVKVQQSYQ